jgi:quinolinate synthase
MDSTGLSEDKGILKEKILKLKRVKNAVILAHNYQIPDIQDLADFVGDSLELAKISVELEGSVIVFCGVKFMAETAKILSPQKEVLLPVLDAGCPLADMIEPNQLVDLKKRHPGAWVVSYVNTSAQIKALSNVCCTSSNAIKVVENIPVKEIIFVPDKNLGWWVQKNVPQKELIIWEGFCYVHQDFTLEHLEQVKQAYPDAEVIVHPECQPPILERADYVLSTSGMLKRASASDARRFIIGTEEGLIYRLKKENPDKEFYPLSSAGICTSMKKTTLKELYQALQYGRYQINLKPQIIDNAKRALEEMVRFI